MLRPMATVAALGTLTIVARAAEPAQPQYLIHVRLTQQAACDGQSEKVLAAPTVTTVENREACFHVGGEKTIAGQTVEYGTKLKVRVQAAADGRVTLRGMLETAVLSEGVEELATRTSTANYFQRIVPLDETVTFRLPASDAHRSLECRVEKVKAESP